MNWPPRPTWPDAACIGRTAEMTMPHLDRPDGERRGLTNTRAGIERVRRAKDICATCPVLEDCRRWALSWPDPCEGLVAGGLTPAERTRARP